MEISSSQQSPANGIASPDAHIHAAKLLAVGADYQNATNSSNGVADMIASAYAGHSSGQRINTDVVMVERLRATYPDLALTVSPKGTTDLLTYAKAGHATATLQQNTVSALGMSHKWQEYVPPAQNINEDPGTLSEKVLFGKFMYSWRPVGGQDKLEFILYITETRDGSASCPNTILQYILSAPNQQHLVNELLLANGQWLQELHGEIWVFDHGAWRKDSSLWDAVEKAEWSDVILDEDIKNGIQSDIEGFFDAKEIYKKLRVPWKRGVIFYGPPGNGKTISIKAMMHTLYNRKPNLVPTLYVRSLHSRFGGEYSISQIFAKARRTAPCYLVFEDLDSLVTDKIRSYFLNEVDGISSNDGILMLGSTNYLERLDPSISKRPSRFDRKYLFPNPGPSQREAYCRYWQQKLSDNKDVDFPDRLISAVVDVTKDFSFAYMQEAFVASLLAVARGDKGEKDEHDSLDNYPLWQAMRKNVAALRASLEEGGETAVSKS